MNPDTNKFEPLQEETALGKVMRKLQREQRDQTILVRPDGTPVSEHWSVYQADELSVSQNYTFKVGYLGGGKCMVLEPVGPVVVGEEK